MKIINYLKFLFLILLFVNPITSFAEYVVNVDGINYAIDDFRRTASVYYEWDDEGDIIPGFYSGNIIIPMSITYNGITYSVTSISAEAFWQCNRLTGVTIPNSVRSIGRDAFNGCTGLTDVTIPNSVTSIDTDAFYGCTGLTKVYINNLEAWSSISFSNSISNPCTYAHHLFLNGEEITSLTLPNSITTIKYFAFSGCTGLTDVTIPNSVTSIGSYAFQGCTGLTDVTIPNSVTSIGGYAFHGCTGLTDVTIPNSVTSIGSYAFQGCTGLTDVTIPNSVTSIGSYAFQGCTGLTDVTISAASIGSYAFSGCTGLTDVTIPNSVTSIDTDAFNGCTGLTKVYINNLEAWSSISFSNSRSNPCAYAHHLFLNGEEITSLTLPNSITTIKDFAFYCCTGLTDVTTSAASIGSYAFSGCTGLTDVTISAASIGSYAFSGCTGLKSINFNNVLKSIGTRAFNYCSSLKDLVIPSSVTYIGSYAFASSGVNCLTIPSSVSFIGNSAFASCVYLKDVFCLVQQPWLSTIGDDVFYVYSSYNYANRTLHVPFGMIEAYQVSTNWKDFFGEIVEIGSEIILASSIELNLTEAVLIEGNNLQLSASILPDEASYKMVNWTSNNETVATVNEIGLVTAVTPGVVTITATTNDGSDLSASCTVTVVSPDLPVTENAFLMPDTTVMHGDVIILPVAMTNNEDIVAFQTDIFLPEGFSIVTDEDEEYLVTPSDRMSNDHCIMANDANNGSVRVVCYTPQSNSFSGNEGDLFYMYIQVPDDADGMYNINLCNTRLTTINFSELSIPDASATIEVKQFIPGDVNDSRTVTVTDIVSVAQYILDMNPSPFIFAAADMNADSLVTVTDIMLIAYLINHPTMNAPKRMPALMNVDDSMSGEDVTLMAGETRTVSIALDNMTDYTAFQMDLTLPAGLTASNFQLTDRAGSHTLDVNTLDNGKTRTLCYSPAIEVIDGYEGSLLTFDVTATDNVVGSIIVDDIEMVTANCQTVLMNNFTIGVNSTTSVNELSGVKAVARVDYFNLAGQQIDRPSSGVTLVVTTYTDGTRSTTKVIK